MDAQRVRVHGEESRRQSGITGSDPWWELLHAPYKVKERTRKPSIEDIVKTLILAEEYLDKPLPGRMMVRASVGAGVLAGLWFVVMTCQRSDAAMNLKTYNLTPDLRRLDGWMIASWEAEIMKAGQAQMLPIPPGPRLTSEPSARRRRTPGRNNGPSRPTAIPTPTPPARAYTESYTVWLAGMRSSSRTRRSGSPT